jgi:hypothetical protein
MKDLVHGPNNKALMTEIIKDLLKGKVTKDLTKKGKRLKVLNMMHSKG